MNAIRTFLAVLLIPGTLSLGMAQAREGADLAPGLQRLQGEGPVPVIIHFSDRLDLQDFRSRGADKGRGDLIRALRAKAQSTQAPALALLAERGVGRSLQLWSINALAVRAAPALISELAALPGVARIEPDASVQAPEPMSATTAVAEWNLDAIGAPQFWGQGFTGLGSVIASMDTGVDVQHPDLAPRWRGGNNSWFDPHGEHATPYDKSGHGTQVMGLALGGEAGGTAIGVAPGAQWIAVKIFDDAGLASLSAIHQGFQWLLDPDQDPASDDMPDVVNNSWGFANLLDQCYTEFEADIAVLKSAGINVVFSGGNLGPSLYSSVPPANNPGSVAVGSVDSALNVAGNSSRGPSACAGALYPQLVAPGVNVRSSDLTFGGVFPDSYAAVSGSSAAAPHVAGALALLREAYPALAVTDLEQALEQTATDLGQSGADNENGHGLIDIVAAAEWLANLSPPPPPPTCTDSDGDGFFAEAECGTLIDCNDNEAGINPEACDIKGDGIDQDCDGVDRTKGKACPVADGGTTIDTLLGSEGKGSTCSDGIDNDADGLLDCADSDCSKNRACR